MTLAATQTAVPALVLPGTEGQFTAATAQVAVHPQGDIETTQLVVQCLAKRNTTTDRNEPLFTQVAVPVLMSYTPDFGWIDMFKDVLFPFDISYNSIGATRFQTDVSQVDSGGDQRISRWDQPLMEYDVAYGVRTMEQLQGLIAFFRAMRGKLYSFKYLDKTDHTSTTAVAVEARTPPAISCTDQPLGTGDGSTYSFQLVKRYFTPDGSTAFTRTIYKPKADAVLIGVDGVAVTNFQVDASTGVVSFTSDLIVHDVALTMAFENTTQRRITGVIGTFDGFSVGDKIVTTGWVSALNNTTVSDTVTIAGISADTSSIVINAPASGYGAAEAGTKALVRRHPAPKAGKVLTAGFHFYVPVRFDTDRLPVTLEEYGVGSASDVKLVEVRPWDE